MDVKEAVSTAKQYIVSLFDGEEIQNVGLEEVVFEEFQKKWNVTIGFSRSWENTGFLTAAFGEVRTKRSYKVLCIDDVNGKVESMTDRALPERKR